MVEALYRSLSEDNTLEYVASVHRTMLYSGVFFMRALTLVRLIFPNSFGLGATIAMDSLKHWQLLYICSSMPLLPLVMRAVGVLSRETSIFYEVSAVLYGHALKCLYVLISPEVWQGTVQLQKFTVGMTAVFGFTELTRCLLQMGGASPELSLHLRLTHMVVLHAVAYGRYLSLQAQQDNLNLQEGGPLLIFQIVVGTMLIVGLHIITRSFSNMSASLKESRSIIYQQRDVYMGLLENATNGFCSLGENHQGDLQFTDLSPMLQRLLGSRVSTLAVSQVASTQRDIDRILACAHGSGLQAAATPIIITCRVPCEGRNEQVEFEARVIPFRPPEGTLNMCFMLASEKRSVEKIESHCQARQKSPNLGSHGAASGEDEENEEEGWTVDTKNIDDEIQSCLTFDLSVSTAAKLPGSAKPVNTCSIGTQTSGLIKRPPRAPRQMLADQAKKEPQADGAGSSGTSDSSLAAGASFDFRKASARAKRGRMSSSTSESTSSHATSDRQNYLNIVGMLSSFPPADRESQVQSISWLVRHWNVCCVQGCCPWHVALGEAKRIINLASKRSNCQPLWSPLSGWQCTRCSSMNAEKVRFCEICSLKRTQAE